MLRNKMTLKVSLQNVKNRGGTYIKYWWNFALKKSFERRVIFANLHNAFIEIEFKGENKSWRRKQVSRFVYLLLLFLSISISFLFSDAVTYFWGIMLIDILVFLFSPWSDQLIFSYLLFCYVSALGIPVHLSLTL